MKSYTDLEQSKVLSEILRFENADMLWGYYFNGKNHCIPNIRPFRDGRNEIPKGYIPAWSLAALLNVLPRFIEFKGDKYYLRFMKEYVEYFNDEISITGRYLHTTGNDNLVDACYEMILKLHELKML